MNDAGKLLIFRHRSDIIYLYGDIAQLVRAFGSHPRGRGFEPRCLYQIEKYRRGGAFFVSKFVMTDKFSVIISEL